MNADTCASLELRRRLEASVRGAIKVDANKLTVAELVHLYLDHGTADYSERRGTTEVQNYRDATRELLQIYGNVLAAEFGVLELKAVRALMVENGLCRDTINKQRIRRIRTIFRWATENHDLNPATLTRLQSVIALRPGVAGVAESKRKLPPTVEQIVAVLNDEKCPRVNRDMLKFQRLTSARPGEVCGIRGDEIDQSRSPWEWRPVRHKNAWRNKSRVIFIGPAAQLCLLPYMNDGFLFLTKRGRTFRVDHYHQMIDESCERMRVLKFSPQSVRRMALTEADELTDLETAQELASHADPRTTEGYLNRGGRRARNYAQERG